MHVHLVFLLLVLFALSIATVRAVIDVQGIIATEDDILTQYTSHVPTFVGLDIQDARVLSYVMLLKQKLREHSVDDEAYAMMLQEISFRYEIIAMSPAPFVS